MTRLRHVSSGSLTWRRRPRGKGFSYYDDSGALSDADAQRCRDLVIPPAWTDVRICPIENGHLQAIGTDDAGRRQYLYHPDWKPRQDQDKFESMLEFAQRLPTARRYVRKDLAAEDTDLDRACALAFRLLDLGAFRLGSPRYADENGSYGLLSLERRHVRQHQGALGFDYVAKSQQERQLTITDGDALSAIRAMRARRAPTDAPLLVYKDRGRWHELRTEQLTSYLKARISENASAKDFRTWQANVLAAAYLAVNATDAEASSKRIVADAMKVVAEYLGNTPAVARSGYVDPRVVDLFEDGVTIEPKLAARCMPTAGSRPSPALERAVLGLLQD